MANYFHKFIVISEKRSHYVVIIYKKYEVNNEGELFKLHSMHRRLLGCANSIEENFPEYFRDLDQHAPIGTKHF